MADREATTQTLDVTEARRSLSQVLDRVKRSHERVIVEEGGVPVAAIISARDLERFHQLEQERAREFDILDEIGEVFKDESTDEAERLARQAVAEAREIERRGLHES